VPGSAPFRWDEDTITGPISVSTAGYLRAGLRAVLLIGLIFGGLVILLGLRLIERPVFGLKRPLTPYITQVVCRTSFRIMGIRYLTQGIPMAQPGAVVANHSSWLDILALNAAKRIYFVSKSEVAGWPGIGVLAKATGTVFITRDRREAAAQLALFQGGWRRGTSCCSFPRAPRRTGGGFCRSRPRSLRPFCRMPCATASGCSR
jgi:lyso-ornithine lipid O-acyltransferase